MGSAEEARKESENLFQERADCVWFAAKKCPDIASQGIFMEITRQQQGFKSPETLATKSWLIVINKLDVIFIAELKSLSAAAAAALRESFHRFCSVGPEPHSLGHAIPSCGQNYQHIPMVGKN